MNRLFTKKLITTIFFVGFLFIFSIKNIIVSYNPIKDILKNEGITLDEAIKLVETAANENVYKKYSFIYSYGYLQRLMNKNEENNFEVIKDKQGFLQYTYFADKPNPIYDIALRTQAFKNGLKNKETKFIYLMPPDKYIRGYSELPIGIPYNYANETADDFINLLNKNAVDTIDLRENLLESGISLDDLFFKTDHHWKIETAFWEFGQLVNKLNLNYDMNLDKDNYYTNKENYNFIKYEDSYLGSMGRKVGKYYGGIDDFTLVYPKFKTSYSHFSKTGEQEFNLEGRFEDVLLSISPFTLDQGMDSLEVDKYFSYLYGNRGIVHVVNKDNSNGPKILFVKDSLAVPLATFLTTVCSEVYLVDPRYYKEDIPTFINNIDNLDMVFMSFSPQNLTKEFFPFYEEK